jgi:uncharacterized protein YuzE
MLRGLFVRFRRMEHVDGEPTGDGRVIVYYDKRGKVVAVEITDNNPLKLGELWQRVFIGC